MSPSFKGTSMGTLGVIPRTDGKSCFVNAITIFLDNSCMKLVKNLWDMLPMTIHIYAPHAISPFKKARKKLKIGFQWPV